MSEGVTPAALDTDAHGVFRRFRRLGPVLVRNDGLRIVLRAADVRALTTDPRLMSPETMNFGPGPLRDFSTSIMLFSNGATHARRRAPFVRLLAYPAVARLRAEVRAAADALITGWIDDGRTELVGSFAARLPSHVIGRLLGLPEPDLPRFVHLVTSVARFLSEAGYDPRDMPQIERDLLALRADIAALLEARRRVPRDDFLAGYLASVEADGAMSPGEAVAQIAFVILAAVDTLRFALAAQVVLLLGHPAQWAAVRADPGCRRAAVLEALRFEPAAAAIHRWCREPVALDGTVLPAGSVVMLSAMSALRDEAAHVDPDTFDIARPDQAKGHLAFGGGAHRCLGEALAVLQLEEALGALATRLPGLSLVGPPPAMRGYAGIRRIGPVEVTWS